MTWYETFTTGTSEHEVRDVTMQAHIIDAEFEEIEDEDSND